MTIKGFLIGLFIVGAYIFAGSLEYQDAKRLESSRAGVFVSMASKEGLTMISGLSTDASCTKGNLQMGSEYDIYCPLFGGPVYKHNYLSSSCRERQLLSRVDCRKAKCNRFVADNLARPSKETKSEMVVLKEKKVKGCQQTETLKEVSITLSFRGDDMKILESLTKESKAAGAEVSSDIICVLGAFVSGALVFKK